MGKQKFIQAPLPFQGQKRMFLGAFKQALGYFSPTATYVDLFGGSGLLSYTTKQHYPQAKVIYNDYDNYVQRLRNIDKTNALLADIRQIVIKSPTYRKSEKLEEKYKKQVLKRIEQERGFVDYITLSANLVFSSKFCKNFEELKNQNIYTYNTKITNYNFNIQEYLHGLEVVREDYHDLYKEFFAASNAVFIIDPPYFKTNTTTYNDGLLITDTLNILKYLQQLKYIFFTSSKSHVVEIGRWLQKNTAFCPFKGAFMLKKTMHPNHKSKYLDIMIFKNKK